MPNITLTVSAKGDPDSEDALGIRRLIRIENGQRALQDPPVDPLSSEDADLLTSYQVIWDSTAERAHTSYIDQAIQEEPDGVSQDKVRELKKELRAANSKGIAYETIITAVKGLPAQVPARVR